MRGRKDNNLLLMWRVLCTAVTVLFVAFIFLNSAQTAQVSGGHSLAVVEWLNGFLSGMGLNWEVTDHMVRKTAHFGEYALLGILLTATLYTYTSRVGRNLAVLLLLGLLTAVCDEFLQTFVEGRSGQVSDVLLDFGGLCTGVLIGGLLVLALLHRQQTLRDRRRLVLR